MPEDKIWATIYEDDEEAYEIWKGLGVPDERIVRLGKDDNFWEIGLGPCGPDSEIFFDRGPEYGCGKPDCKPGCDCDRYIEFWNHVFTQFSKEEDGSYSKLAHPNIDTGMGLERMACLMQGVTSIFDVDTIRHILDGVVEKSGVAYQDGQAETDVSIRIITDHLRSMDKLHGAYSMVIMLYFLTVLSSSLEKRMSFIMVFVFWIIEGEMIAFNAMLPKGRSENPISIPVAAEE